MRPGLPPALLWGIVCVSTAAGRGAETTADRAGGAARGAARDVASDPTAWPSFRGPRGDGTSDASELPREWGEGRNVRWKTAIHGRGWSTPAVRDGRIWLTTAAEDGRVLSALSVDRETGRVLHDLRIFEVESPQPLGNPVNSYASPSPALDEARAYVHFGSYGTASLDAGTGRTLWTRRDLPCDHFRGPGSSPVLFGDLLILTFDGFDVQYLAALDRRTGETVWRTPRSFDFGDMDGDLRKAYSTPAFFETDGVPSMVSSGAKATYAYDPRTGRELWRVRYDGFSNASMPVRAGGIILVNTGFGKADLLAVRPGGAGDVTETHVVWSCTQGVPLKPSPIVAGGRVYLFGDSGIATCIDAATGAIVWKERLGGSFSASPILGAGRIYVPDEEGTTTVIRPGERCEILARNRLDAGCMASPATSGRSIILRTRTHLYRIEETGGTSQREPRGE